MVTMATMAISITYTPFHLDDLQVVLEVTHLVITVVAENPKLTSGLQEALIQAVLTGTYRVFHNKVPYFEQLLQGGP